MAAKPLPMPDDPPVIYIDSDGKVSQDVEIDNGGQITIKVNSYKPGNNQCKITISAGNISWHHKDTEGGSTIKVGGGTND